MHIARSIMCNGGFVECSWTPSDNTCLILLYSIRVLYALPDKTPMPFHIPNRAEKLMCYTF